MALLLAFNAGGSAIGLSATDAYGQSLGRWCGQTRADCFGPYWWWDWRSAKSPTRRSASGSGFMRCAAPRGLDQRHAHQVPGQSSGS